MSANGKSILGGDRKEKKTQSIRYHVFQDTGVSPGAIHGSYIAKGYGGVLRANSLDSLAERLSRRDSANSLRAVSFDSPRDTNRTYSVLVPGDEFAESAEGREDRIDWYHSRALEIVQLVEFTRAYNDAYGAE